MTMTTNHFNVCYQPLSQHQCNSISSARFLRITIGIVVYCFVWYNGTTAMTMIYPSSSDQILSPNDATRHPFQFSCILCFYIVLKLIYQSQFVFDLLLVIADLTTFQASWWSFPMILKFGNYVTRLRRLLIG